MTEKKQTTKETAPKGDDVLRQALFGDLYQRMKELEETVKHLEKQVNDFESSLDELENNIDEKVEEAMENNFEDKVKEIAEEVVNNAEVSISV